MGVLAAGAYFWMEGRSAARIAASEKAHQAPKPMPVVIAAARRDAVPIEVTGLGTVQAFASVQVRSRIDGEILAVHFREGDTVKANDLLFTLDARAAEAQLRQAQADLARDKAQLANAQRELARTKELASRGVAAQANLEKAQTDVDVLQAAVAADQATIDNLNVQRGYTEIRAPMAGRTGVVHLTAGNIVRASDSQPLVTINQVQPVRALAAIPQRHFEDIRKGLAAGELDATAANRDLPGRTVAGKVNFLDNAVDTPTGTFQVRATFANEDGILWPGMFANVTVTLGVQPDALVVPVAAVQTGARGTYVFVVTGDNLATIKPVTVVRQRGSDAAITGIAENDNVVVDGQLRLVEGTRVEIQKPGAAPAAAAPPSGTNTPGGTQRK